MTIRGHVGGNEQPLGKLVVLEVLVEHGARLVDHGQVLVLRDVLLKVGDAVSEHSRVVLADIVVGASLLVLVSLALKSGKGHVFLVVAPRDASVQEKVVDGRDVVWQAKEVVVLHAKVVTSDSSHVVGLRRVSDGEVVGQSDTLLSEEVKVDWLDNVSKVDSHV